MTTKVPIPPRDMLPSSRPDHVTKALDASYEGGFNVGRRAGLEAASEIIRAQPFSNENIKLLELIHQEKYK